MSRNATTASRSRALRIAGAVGAGAMVLGMVSVGAAVADSGSGDHKVSSAHHKSSRLAQDGPKGYKSREAKPRRLDGPKAYRSREAGPRTVDGPKAYRSREAAPRTLDGPKAYRSREAAPTSSN